VAGETRAETGGDDVVEGLRSKARRRWRQPQPRRDVQSRVTEAKGYGQEA
jgi:hypothetical protein